LYEDSADYLVQGYVITDQAILDQLQIPEGETVVRVPKDLMNYLPEENYPAQRRGRRGRAMAVTSEGVRHISPGQ
jgi:hypothetical protein